MEHDSASWFSPSRERKQAKCLGRFLIILTIVSCLMLPILYILWEYLNASAVLSSFKGVALAKQIQATPTAVPAGSYLGYTAHVFSSQGNSMVYYLYTPTNYNPAQKYPLVLVLQGGGERSNPKKSAAQNEELLIGNPYAAVWSSAYNAPGNPQIQKNWPCFVVVPQMTLSQQWVNVDVHKGSYTQPAQPSVPLALTKELLDTLQRQYTGIDANRLYITGLSNGGYGTWDAIERWPDYFAAAAPISGAGDPSKAAVLKNLPIWAFHGSADPTVPVDGSRDMIAAIQSAGGFPKYTEFSGMGHIIWPYVYSLNTSSSRVTGFFSWLFAQHK